MVFPLLIPILGLLRRENRDKNEGAPNVRKIIADFYRAPKVKYYSHSVRYDCHHVKPWLHVKTRQL